MLQYLGGIIVASILKRVHTNAVKTNKSQRGLLELMGGEEEHGEGAPAFPKEELVSQRQLWGINRIFNPEMQSLSRFSDEELQDPLAGLPLKGSTGTRVHR